MQINDIKILKLGLTTKCNGRCIMCWHSNRDQQEHVELDNKIYQELKNTLFHKIKVLDLISGGEIFFYTGIEELLNDSLKYDYLLKIATNGTSISEHHKNILKRLNVEFVISLDAANAELHEKLRVGCSFDKVIQSIKYFVENGKKVHIRTCVSNHNFYEMHKILELAKRLDVAGVKFQTVQYLESVKKPYSFTKPPKDMTYLKSLKGNYSIAFDYFHKHMYHSTLINIWNKIQSIKKYTYCPNAKNFLKVDIDGHVLSCSMPDAVLYGDLNKNSLTEIINNCETIRRNCTCKPMEKYLRR